MRIDGAVMTEGGLLLNTNDFAARRFVYGFKPGEYDIAPAKKKRSLDANAYAWVLIDKIAEAVKLPKVEVYRNAIRNIGGVADVVCVRNAAVEKLCQGWSKNGLGWQAETTPSKIDGCTNVVLYYGSSSYNVHQMSILIDFLVQDAKALDIEVRPAEEIESLLESWGKKP